MKHTEQEVREKAYRLRVFAKASEMLTAYADLLAQPAAVPDGWVLIRREPLSIWPDVLKKRHVEMVRFAEANQGEPPAAPQPSQAEPQQSEPVEINTADIRIDTFATQRSGFVLRPDDGVRITHMPTGTVVEESSERSQHRNRAVAIEKLQQLLEQHPAPAPGTLTAEQIFGLFVQTGLGAYHLPRQEMTLDYDRKLLSFARAIERAALAQPEGAQIKFLKIALANAEAQLEQQGKDAERYRAIRLLAECFQPPIDPNMSVAIILPWDDDKLTAPEALDAAADEVIAAKEQ